MNTKIGMGIKGSVLFLVIIFVFITTLIGMGLIYLSSTEEIFAYQDNKQTRALYIAEAGLERSAAYIREDPYFTNPVTPFGNGSTNTLLESNPIYAQGKFSTTIYPSASNATSATSKEFLVISSGIVYDSTGAESVVKILKSSITIDSDMRYVYFSDEEYPGGAVNLSNSDNTNRIFFAGPQLDEFIGRVHSNDEISIAGSPDFHEDSVGNYDMLSTNIGFQTYNGTNNKLPSITVPRVEMFKLWRKELKRMEEYAKANDVRNPSGVGNHSSFYLNNNVTIMLSTQQVAISGFNNYDNDNWHADPIITDNTDSTDMFQIDPNTETIIYVATANVKIMSYPNEYFTSTVTVVSAYFDPFDVHLGSICIIGNINIAPSNPRGLIGLVATSDIYVSTCMINNNVEIDAFMMSNRMFRSDCWDIPSTISPPPTLTVFGMVVNRTRRELGQVNIEANQPSSSAAGHAKHYIFDTRITTAPPRYFPRSYNLKRTWWKEDLFR